MRSQWEPRPAAKEEPHELGGGDLRNGHRPSKRRPGLSNAECPGRVPFWNDLPTAIAHYVVRSEDQSETGLSAHDSRIALGLYRLGRTLGKGSLRFTGVL